VLPPQTKIDNIKAIETGKHDLIISKGMGRISMFLLPRYSENKKDNKIRRYVCDV
jgi:AMMECR1 domain-containing protein